MGQKVATNQCLGGRIIGVSLILFFIILSVLDLVGVCGTFKITKATLILESLWI